MGPFCDGRSLGLSKAPAPGAVWARSSCGTPCAPGSSSTWLTAPVSRRWTIWSGSIPNCGYSTAAWPVNRRSSPSTRSTSPKCRKRSPIRRSPGTSPVFFVSAATGEGVPALMQETWQTLQQLGGHRSHRWSRITPRVFRPQPKGSSGVHREGAVYVIESPEMERIVARVDVTDPEVMRQVRGLLEKTGIARALAPRAPGETAARGSPSGTGESRRHRRHLRSAALAMAIASTPGGNSSCTA